jgi:hypothetical protein
MESSANNGSESTRFVSPIFSSTLNQEQGAKIFFPVIGKEERRIPSFFFVWRLLKMEVPDILTETFCNCVYIDKKNR